jgi:hypothetical protein
MNDLNEISFDNELKFVLFDISNMYTNISTDELTEIIENMCKQNGLDQTIHNDIMKICKLVIAQNYFQHANNQYIREQGLAMGAPTSSLLPEIYLQHLESTKIFYILRNHQLIGYFRYMDDILIIYKNNLTNILEILRLFNSISTTLTFTMEEETNSSLNFLDKSIHKTDNKISCSIYRKPTFTDTIVPSDSCHPNEHKMAAVRFFANRIVTYPMNDKDICR